MTELEQALKEDKEQMLNDLDYAIGVIKSEKQTPVTEKLIQRLLNVEKAIKEEY